MYTETEHQHMRALVKEIVEAGVPLHETDASNKTTVNIECHIVSHPTSLSLPLDTLLARPRCLSDIMYESPAINDIVASLAADLVSLGADASMSIKRNHWHPGVLRNRRDLDHSEHSNTTTVCFNPLISFVYSSGTASTMDCDTA